MLGKTNCGTGGGGGTTTITFDLYSAAQDTVYYYDGSTRVNLCTTDSTGKATGVQLNIPSQGLDLTLWSSVADNPDNLSEKYSKNIHFESSTNTVNFTPIPIQYAWGGYIENTLGSYILTDIYFNSLMNLKVVLTHLSLNNSWLCYIGTKVNDNNKAMEFQWYGVAIDSEQPRFCTAGANGIRIEHDADMKLNTKYIFEYKDQISYQLDGTTKSHASAGNWTAQYPLAIFGSNYAGSIIQSNGGIGRIYLIRINSENTNICLLPCYRRSDNKVGFYDSINDKFYTVTSGNMTCGTVW